MGKFRQKSTELLPLICVEMCFCALSWLFFWPILFKLCIYVNIGEEWFGIIDG